MARLVTGFLEYIERGPFQEEDYAKVTSLDSSK